MRCLLAVSLALAACSDSTPPLQTAQPGVVFTFPIDKQVDVPLGARIVVTFSDEVVASAVGDCSAFCLKGPNGPVAVTPTVVGDGKSVEIVDAPLEPGTKYEIHVGATLAPAATNLKTGPLVTFTTRTVRPRAAPPLLVAVNGGEPTRPDSFRPMYESSTIRLLFSERSEERRVGRGRR